MLTRANFLKLTGLNSDGLMALKRRDQIPFLDDTEGYTLFSAYTHLLADRFAEAPDGHGMKRTIACDIIRDAGRDIAMLGEEIEFSSRSYRLDANSPNILVGRIGTAFTPDGTKLPFCGTIKDLAERNLDTVDVMLTSATATMAVLLQRMQRIGLTAEAMWPEPTTIPSYTDRHEERLARLHKAAERINNRYSEQ